MSATPERRERTKAQIVCELDKRAKSFKRHYLKHKDKFSLGAYSNLEAMALWAKSKRRSRP